MNHHDLREKLSAYMDGEVSPEERSAIEEHLKVCAACSQALGELRETAQRVKTLQEVEPPAWMTHKIMAQVRSKAEPRTSIWQKLFFPLHVKLPIEAVTALFCVVLGYYVYQSAQPAVKLAEAPVQYEQESPAGKKEAPKPSPASQPVSEPGSEKQAGTGGVRQAVKDEAKIQASAAKAEREQTAGQPAAGYRERKAAPTPSTAPAQTPVEQRSVEAAAPQSAGNQPEAARDTARSEVRAKAAAGPAGALAVAKAPASEVNLLVTDLEKATTEVKDNIGQAGGSVVRTDSGKNEVVISATIPPARLEGLIDHLNKLGRIRDRNLLPAQSDAPVCITITITPEPREP